VNEENRDANPLSAATDQEETDLQSQSRVTLTGRRRGGGIAALGAGEVEWIDADRFNTGSVRA